MRALVTGAAGFVGTHLVRYLSARGDEVFPVDRRGSEPLDLCDRASVIRVVTTHRPTHVFHLAGLLRADDPADLYRANVIATAHLVDALLAMPSRPTTVIASSSAVYGVGPASSVMTEDSKLAPLNHYAASKVGQESVARQAMENGLQVLIARTFNVVGPGQPASLAAGSFAEQIARAEGAPHPRIETGELTALRDFVDVRDVVRALVALSQHQGDQHVFNICTGMARPVSACVAALVAAARVPVEVVHAPSRTHTTALVSQVGSAERLERATGWRPEIPFEQSMNDLLESWRQTVLEERRT